MQGIGSISLVSSSTQRQVIDARDAVGLPGVFVVMPGLGEASRVPWIRENIKILKSELGKDFACFLRIYAEGAKSDPNFDANLFAPCTVEYNKDLKLFASVKAVDVMDAAHVFLVLDDILLDSSTLSTMRRMLHNESSNLDVVSATYKRSFCDKMKPQKGQLAHASTYVEINAVLFKRSAFTCLQNHIDPILNPMGVGYGAMLHAVCPVNISICDACEVQHMSGIERENNHTAAYDHHEAGKNMRNWVRSLAQEAQKLRRKGPESWDWCVVSTTPMVGTL
jgi:hypothetical protein